MAGDDQKTAVEKLESKGGFPLSHRAGDLYQSIDRNLLYLDLEPDVSLSTARRTVKLSAAPLDMTCIRDECKERPVEMACIRDLAQGVSSWGRRLSFANGGADDGKREGGGQIKSARCGRFLSGEHLFLVDRGRLHDQRELFQLFLHGFERAADGFDARRGDARGVGGDTIAASGEEAADERGRLPAIDARFAYLFAKAIEIGCRKLFDHLALLDVCHGLLLSQIPMSASHRYCLLSLKMRQQGQGYRGC